MSLFAESDRSKLTGPAGLFDNTALREKHADWGHQLLRAAVALEILTQITRRGQSVLLKGGTLLQNSLTWPPYRASVDLDLEVEDAQELEESLAQIEDSFSRSEVRLTVRETPLPGFTGYVQFPRAPGPDWELRIDALENDRWPSGSSPWQEIPTPWKARDPPMVAPVETRAAQKLLLAADSPYGRDLEDHLGRQNFVKDLFDLHCLGEESIEEQRVLDAAREDVERKSEYLDEEFHLDTVLDSAVETYRLFAHPPVDDDSLRGSLWRAYGRVKSGIRIPFTRADLRVSAGCAHHAIESVQREELDWEDTWRPALSGTPRSSWEGEEISPVVEVSDDFGPTTGPLEAWARFEP
jgi:hypothetical protein